MDNFKERNDIYLLTCEHEIRYYKNSVRTVEAEIGLQIERLNLDKRYLALAEENLKEFKKSIKE